MLGSPYISTKALAPFCRSMGRMLGAGVELRKCLSASAKGSSDSRLLEGVKSASKKIRKGDGLTDAFSDRHEFPALFHDMLNVGEQTGAMPEVFESMAKYYESQVERVRNFRSQIAMPVFQLIAAILIIGVVLYIIGMITDGESAEMASSLLIPGLSGTTGAKIWFGTWAFIFVAGIISWILLARSTAGQQALHPFLMTIPGLSYCMKTLAIARFSWCFSLTQRAGMDLKPSIEASLNATSNGAFVNAIPFVWNDVKQGESLTTALTNSRLFPDQYLSIVQTAEESGTVPEQLHRLSHQFDEDASRAMTWLAAAIAKIIWGLVACFIGFIIIRFFVGYINLLNSQM